MSNSGGVISAPVDVRGDIAAVLGVQSGDLGVLCTNAAVNKWSKRKPVEWSGKQSPGSQDLTALHYGLNLNPRLVTDLLSGYSGFYWDYTRPSTWFRTLDFDGYKHNATRPSVNFYSGGFYTNRPSLVHFHFDSDGSDITIADMEYPTTSHTIPATEELGDWNVVVLIYITGKTPQLYNSGITLSSCTGTTVLTVDIASAISTSDLGKTAVVMPALVYANSDMTVGLHTLSASFMMNYYVLPLSFTSSMESVVSSTIQDYQALVGGQINYTQFIPVQMGHGYYALTFLAITASGNNYGSDTIPFSARLVLKRNGSEIGVSQTVSETLSNQTALPPPYDWEFSRNASNEVVFGSAFIDPGTGTAVSPQAGDVIDVEVKVLDSGIAIQTLTTTVTTI